MSRKKKATAGRAPAAKRARKPARAAAKRPRPPAGDLLAIDVGTSETDVALFRGAEPLALWRRTSARATADELVAWLDAMLNAYGESGAERPAAPQASVVGSVVAPLTAAWAEALAHRTGRAALVVTPGMTTSMRVRYDRGALGVDRLANAFAARALHGTPAIVVDLGTATTFDCVSRTGSYLGGAIAPGVTSALEGLTRRARHLPHVELRRPAKAIGTTTAEALQSGVWFGAAAQIDAVVRQLALEMQGEPQVVATGGLAPLVAPACETIHRVDEMLTLQGLRLLWEESR